jgi:release factor glutamine methyltransferase
MNKEVFQEYLDQISDSVLMLDDKPAETPESTLKALWLMAHGVNTSVENVEKHVLPDLTPETRLKLDQLIDTRKQGIPLAHITGRQSFMGVEMLAGPEALIPRKETELLVDSVLNHEDVSSAKELNIIDVCTGSGNIALAIAANINYAHVYACDLSEDAINLANKNLDHLDLGNLVSFFCGDLFEPLVDLGLEGEVDVITCNPPYISSAKVQMMPDEISRHEPSMAFDGGTYGLKILKNVITGSVTFLKSGGLFFCEVGLGQADFMKKQIDRVKEFSHVSVIKDADGNGRVVYAVKE